MWFSATTLASSAKSERPSTASTPTCAAFATSQPSVRVPHQRPPAARGRVGSTNTPTTAAYASLPATTGCSPGGGG